MFSFAASATQLSGGAAATDKRDAMAGGGGQPEVQKHTGQFTHSVPIEVPEFFGLEPELSLRYTSGGSDGYVGVGWELSGLSMIQRTASTGSGAPRYSPNDASLLDGNELEECANITTDNPSCDNGGTHALKSESRAKIRLEQPGAPTATYWSVTAPDGSTTTYQVGAYTNSAGSWNAGFAVPVGADMQPYLWTATKEVDTHGNRVDYNWNTNLFSCCWNYIDSITYNGNTIKFYWESKNATAGIANGIGFRETMGRIKTITVSNTSGNIRAYKLSYGTSGNTGRNLLTSVTEYGKDYVLTSGTVTGGTTIGVPYAFSYSAGTNNFSFTNWGSSTYAGYSFGTPTSNPRHFTGDFNADGRTDVMFTDAAGNYVVGISNGTGFNFSTWAATGTFGFAYGTNSQQMNAFVADYNGDGTDDFMFMSLDGIWWVSTSWGTGMNTFANWHQAPGWAGYMPSTANVGNFVGDFNGDGKADHMWVTSGEYHLMTSTGTSFVHSLWASTPGWGYAANPQSGNARPMVADFNGDGRSDFAFLWADGNIWVSLTNEAGTAGEGFSLWFSNSGFASLFSPSSGASRIQSGDFNGDGLTDILAIQNDGNFYVLESRGAGFDQSIWRNDGVWGIVSQPNSCRGSVADYNGDGRDDFLFTYPDGAVWVYQNLGSGFAAAVQWASVGANVLTPDNAAASFGGDFNGDGKADFGFTWPDGAWHTGLSSGASNDYLNWFRLPMGGTGTVSYASASNYDTSGTTPPISGLVVSSTSIDDGRSGAVTTNYSYTGPLFDKANKMSLGFATVKETNPCITGETQCPYTLTTYNQTPATSGQPIREEQRTGAGVTLEKTEYTYYVREQIPRYCYVNTETETSYDNAGANGRSTQTQTVYDWYRNPQVITNYGFTTASGDEKRQVLTYAYNTSAFIVSLPYDDTMYNAATGGSVIAQRRLFYDNAATASTAPTKGDVTREEVWEDFKVVNQAVVASGAYLPVTRTYDTYGNVTQECDATNACVTTVFDPTYHMYPITVTNELSQTTTTTFDYRCGEIDTVTDANNVVITDNTFDNLCRISRVDGALGNYRTVNWFNLGTPTTQYVEERTPHPSGTGELYTRQYLDGLGRLYKATSKGTTALGDIVALTEYNERGKPRQTVAPYYSLQTAPAATIITYDALDRRTLTTLPDGNTVSVSYTGDTTTTTDEVGAVLIEKADAYGNVVNHTEVSGGTNYTNVYVFDAAGRLLSSTDPSSNVTTYTVNSLGQTLKEVEPNSGTSYTEFNTTGEIVNEWDGNGDKTAYVVDALGRKTSATSKAGTANANTVTLTYDEVRAGYYNKGRPTSTTDASGGTTVNYDAAGRPVTNRRTTDGVNYDFTSTYTVGGQVLYETSPSGDNFTSAASPITFDEAGRIKTIPQVVTNVEYNADHRPTKIVHANGVTTERSYSAARRWLSTIKSYTGSSCSTFTNTLTNPSFEVNTTTWGSWQATLTREAQAGAPDGSFVVKVAQNAGTQSTIDLTDTSSVPMTAGQTWTLKAWVKAVAAGDVGKVAKVIMRERVTQTGSFTDYASTGVSLTTSWQEVTLTRNAVITGFMDVMVNLSSSASGNGMYVDNIRLYQGSGGGTGCLQDLSYGRDNEGKITSVTSAGANNAKESWSYTYDSLKHLATATNTSDTALNQTFTYNAIGNMLTNSALGTYAYNTSGAGSVRPHAPKGAGTALGFDYDTQGQMTAYRNAPSGGGTVTHTLAFNGEHRLKTFTNVGTGVVTSYAYAANSDVLVKKTHNGVVTHFVGDYYQVSGNVHTKYIGIGGMLVARRDKNMSTGVITKTFIHTSNLGSVQVVTDNTGAEVLRKKYTPYGFEHQVTGSAIESRGFTGQRLDENGLIYLHARFYRPDLGRFVSADEKVPNDKLIGLNRYSYANSDPINYDDVDGYSGCGWDIAQWGNCVSAVASQRVMQPGLPSAFMTWGDGGPKAVIAAPNPKVTTTVGMLVLDVALMMPWGAGGTGVLVRVGRFVIGAKGVAEGAEITALKASQAAAKAKIDERVAKLAAGIAQRSKNASSYRRREILINQLKNDVKGMKAKAADHARRMALMKSDPTKLDRADKYWQVAREHGIIAANRFAQRTVKKLSNQTFYTSTQVLHLEAKIRKLQRTQKAARLMRRFF